MSYHRRSRFVYGDDGDWTTDLSAKPWTPADFTVGGSRTSAAGIPASYVVRRDALIELPLRVTEGEWPTFLGLIAFGQTAESFVWYPEATSLVGMEVYLESPLAGERWSPARMGGFERVFDVTITLRAVTGSLSWFEYFDDDPADPVQVPGGGSGDGVGDGGGEAGGGSGDLLNVSFDDSSFGSNLVPWATSPAGAPAIVTDGTATGGKSVQMNWVGGQNNNKGVLCWVPGGARPVVHVRFRYKLPATADISGIMKLIRFRGPGDKAIGTFNIQASQWLHWTDDFTDGANHFATGSTPDEALDTWIWVEAMADWSSGTSGVFKLWINDVLRLDYTRSGVSYSDGIESVYLWGYFNNPADSRSEWIDQFAMGTVFIGMP